MKMIKAKIALIDDDRDTLKLLNNYFENLGYETLMYDDALKAFEDISNAKLICDVIVTDFSLPEMSGIEFTKRMKSIGNQTPIIERKEDIIPLAEFFLNKFSVLNNIRNKYFSNECIEAMLNHPWQGNVRELENAIERALVLAETDRIEANDVITVDQSDTREAKVNSAFDFGKISRSRLLSVEELINKYICYALEMNQGVKEKTAKDLQIDRKTLYRRLKEIEGVH